MMTIIKIGIPCRWNKTVMVRRVAGEELSARFISAHTANIPLTEKTTSLSTYAHILERNHLPATTAHTVQQQRTNSFHISEHILEKNHFPAHTVTTVQPKKTSLGSTFALIQEKSHSTVHFVLSAVLQRIHWTIIFVFTQLSIDRLPLWTVLILANGSHTCTCTIIGQLKMKFFTRISVIYHCF